MRLDRYLWAVRLYKTKSMASDACKSGKVRMHDENIKPAKSVSQGQVFQVKREGLWLSYRIKKELPSRVKNTLVSEYLENITKPEVLEQLEILGKVKSNSISRGFKGRPTKKVRRDWEKGLNF